MEIFNLAEELEKERKKNKEQQERINEFKLTIRVQNMQIEELINRIDKAIEYIEKYCEDYVIEDSPDEMCLFYNENGGYKPEAKEELLDILKGE